ASAGSLVITLTASPSDVMRISVDEFSGVAASGALHANSANSLSTPAMSWNAGNTAITSGELVYAGTTTSAPNATLQAGSTNGVAMTLGGRQTGSNGAVLSEYVLGSAAGIQSSSATSSAAGTWAGGQATFKVYSGTPLATYYVGPAGSGTTCSQSAPCA